MKILRWLRNFIRVITQFLSTRISQAEKKCTLLKKLRYFPVFSIVTSSVSDFSMKRVRLNYFGYLVCDNKEKFLRIKKNQKLTVDVLISAINLEFLFMHCVILLHR